MLDALETFLRLPAEHGKVADADAGAARPQVRIVSDSTYVVNCFRDSWYRGWLARGWKNSQKQPVANQDLWKPLIALYLEYPSQVTFEWVKGHSGNRMNDVVDTLAVAAAASQSSRRLLDPTGWFVTAAATAVDPTTEDLRGDPGSVPEQKALF